ncbi:PREDICTED: E3 ubiquitin-protein ligase RNF180 [Ficedula albicollis]|uniref:E3 ubiquitin-protein ligase RNF180 n=1 Tax=Ficedula albicollis TaxID=59894 RepID=UPI000359EB39|nr:PREDICTED: E3 ubiquitin-protein ligase RNF180 [Ficedula albicollis]
MSNQEAGVLRCWSCTKHIANAVFLAKCNGKETSKITQSSAAAQNSCNVWHVSLEAIPEWVKCVIEKAQWKIGKLHCPFCEACLGSFNFVCNKECSCGQLVNRHFCKTWTEHQPPFSVKLSKSSEKHLLLKIQSGFNKDTCHEVVNATLEIKNHGLSCPAGSNNSAGRLTEALCLEVRTPRYEIESKKLPLKASCYPIKDAFTVNPFHGRSRSLDLNTRGRFVLSPVLYETCSMGTLYRGRNENPPAYIQGNLQLESSRKDSSSFQDLYSSSADILQNQFQVTSITKLLHKETESECDFEVTGQSSGSIIADGSPFVINLSSPTRAVEDKQYITHGNLVRPMSISFNQKLSKRERNKSNCLRRKQRRREQCLQKQPANDHLHTDDEHELRGDKESYLCAVCLDVYFNPYMCYPCHHIFCEPCLRMLAKDNPTSTPCPLCRTTIARVFFQTDLNNSTRSFFPVEYLNLKENFQKSNSAKWPLPSCKKAFRVFEGFRRHSNTVTRRHFPHAAHRMDYMDFEDDSRGWRFDMDMVIIYIYSVNWIIGFIVFCFLCYFFFPL